MKKQTYYVFNHGILGLLTGGEGAPKIYACSAGFSTEKSMTF